MYSSRNIPYTVLLSANVGEVSGIYLGEYKSLPRARGAPYNPAGAGFSTLVGAAVFSLAVFCTGIVASIEVQQTPLPAMTSSDTPRIATLRLGKGP